jgi:hypothetical protein
VFDYDVHTEGNMKAGEIVLVPVNGGQWCEGEVIEIHGDIVRVAGPSEMETIRREGRPPLGIGFPVQVVRLAEKAKTT